MLSVLCPGRARSEIESCNSQLGHRSRERYCLEKDQEKKRIAHKYTRGIGWHHVVIWKIVVKPLMATSHMVYCSTQDSLQGERQSCLECASVSDGLTDVARLTSGQCVDTDVWRRLLAELTDTQYQGTISSTPTPESTHIIEAVVDAPRFNVFSLGH